MFVVSTRKFIFSIFSLLLQLSAGLLKRGIALLETTKEINTAERKKSVQEESGESGDKESEITNTMEKFSLTHCLL